MAYFVFVCTNKIYFIWNVIGYTLVFRSLFYASRALYQHPQWSISVVDGGNRARKILRDSMEILVIKTGERKAARIVFIYCYVLQLADLLSTVQPFEHSPNVMLLRVLRHIFLNYLQSCTECRYFYFVFHICRNFMNF